MFEYENMRKICENSVKARKVKLFSVLNVLWMAEIMERIRVNEKAIPARSCNDSTIATHIYSLVCFSLVFFFLLSKP